MSALARVHYRKTVYFLYAYQTYKTHPRDTTITTLGLLEYHAWYVLNVVYFDMQAFLAFMLMYTIITWYFGIWGMFWMLGNSGIVVIDKFFHVWYVWHLLNVRHAWWWWWWLCLRLQHQIFAIAAPAKVHFFAIVDSGERRHLEV